MLQLCLGLDKRCWVHSLALRELQQELLNFVGFRSSAVRTTPDPKRFEEYLGVSSIADEYTLEERQQTSKEEEMEYIAHDIMTALHLLLKNDLLSQNFFATIMTLLVNIKTKHSMIKAKKLSEHVFGAVVCTDVSIALGDRDEKSQFYQMLENRQHKQAMSEIHKIVKLLPKEVEMVHVHFLVVATLGAVYPALDHIWNIQLEQSIKAANESYTIQTFDDEATGETKVSVDFKSGDIDFDPLF